MIMTTKARTMTSSEGYGADEDDTRFGGDADGEDDRDDQSHEDGGSHDEQR